MPIIVEEVVIAIEVGGEAPKPAATPAYPREDTRALVAECVERVLEILAQREER